MYAPLTATRELARWKQSHASAAFRAGCRHVRPSSAPHAGAVGPNANPRAIELKYLSMTEAGIRIALHVTARTTFVFFLCAFTGRAVRDLWPGRFSLWLAMKRDWFLLATAASHTLHLVAII